VRRLLFTTFAAICALLTSAGLIAWLHSYRTADYVTLRAVQLSGPVPRDRALSILSICGSFRSQAWITPVTDPKRQEWLRQAPAFSASTRPLDRTTRAGIAASSLRVFARAKTSPAGNTSVGGGLTLPHLLPLAVTALPPALWIRSRLRRKIAGSTPPIPRRRLRNAVAVATVAATILLLAAFLTSFFGYGNGELATHAGDTTPDLTVLGHRMSFALIRGRLGLFTAPETLTESAPGYTRSLELDWEWRSGSNPAFPRVGDLPRILRALGFDYDSASPTPQLILPLYPFLIPLLYLSFVILRTRLRASRARRRLSRGQCPACGYDTRASLHRCPECGAPILPPPSAVPAMCGLVPSAPEESTS
jgi:hypothetical protein